jgi:PBP superfamily domain
LVAEPIHRFTIVKLRSTALIRAINLQSNPGGMMKKVLLLSLLFAAYFLALSRIYTVETQVVAGPGISAAIARLFFQELSRFPETQDYEFNVAAKPAERAGDIHSSDKYLFGQTARPLNNHEKQPNKEEIVLARIPVVVAVGTGAGISSLSADQLWKICSGQYNTWRELGGTDAPIEVVGRKSAQTLCAALKSEYALLGSTKFTRTFESQAQLADFFVSAAGSHGIVFGTRQELERMSGVHILTIDGLNLGLQVGLVYDRSNKDHQLVKTVRNFANSGFWANIVSDAGYLPPDPSDTGQKTADGGQKTEVSITEKTEGRKEAETLYISRFADK